MNEATQSFQSLGLSTYEAKALASLFSHHDSTAQDIAQHAEIPYTKIYAILNSLEKQGLVKCTLERPKKYRPLDADSVVSSIIERQEENLKDLKNDAKEHVKLLDKIHSEGAAYQGNGAVWFLPSFNAVWDMVFDCTRTTEKELRILADKWIWRKALGDKKLGILALKQVEKFDTEKRWHAIIPSSFSFTSLELSNLSIEWIKFIGNEKTNFRIIDDQKIYFNAMIKDNTHLGFSFKKPDGEIYSGTLICDETIVRGTLDYFNMLWNQAVPTENKIREAARKELERREKENTIS